MLMPTQESAFASWIPTYSIKAGVAGTEGAAIYSFWFWLPNAIARPVWALLGKYTVSQRARVIVITLTVTSCLLVILQYLQLYSLVCTIGPVVFGTMMACFFTFCMALPLDNGFQNTIANNANFILANAMGEGVINGSLGYLMSIFGFKVMMVVVMVSSVISYGSLEAVIGSFKEDKGREEGREMALIS